MIYEAYFITFVGLIEFSRNIWRPDPHRGSALDPAGELQSPKPAHLYPQPLDFWRRHCGCVSSLLSEVSLTPVRPRGTACPSQSAEHHSSSLQTTTQNIFILWRF